jgi:dihydropyrimidinase
MIFDTLIRNGVVVDPKTGVAKRDIAIAGDKIAAILESGAETAAKRVIDASGKHVFPGLIDAHVHFGFGEPVTEYTTETVYAAQGGFTTILGYLLNNAPYGGVFERELAFAEPRAHIDFGFHFSTAGEDHLAELGDYIRDYGVTSFKYFMNFKGEEGRYLGLDGTDDGFLYALLQKAAALGNPTIVVHTENIELVNRFRAEALERGAEPTLRTWASVKPPFTEAEATVRSMYFAEHLGAKIYIPHLSTRMALDEVRRWRKRYSNIWVETCPHYLTHNHDSDLGGLGKANPPFRSPDDVDAMWEGLEDGSIDVVASDHVPRKKATKLKPFWQASQGFPGTATILPVLLSEGFHKHRLSLERIAQVLTTAPARIFGLDKGSLDVGADADITLVDLNLQRTVRADELGSYSDYSLYDDWTFRGWPVLTMVRGKVVMEDGRIVAPGGHGRFIHRSL